MSDPLGRGFDPIWPIVPQRQYVPILPIKAPRKSWILQPSREKKLIVSDVGCFMLIHSDRKVASKQDRDCR
jgi:hypothetical protein